MRLFSRSTLPEAKLRRVNEAKLEKAKRNCVGRCVQSTRSPEAAKTIVNAKEVKGTACIEKQNQDGSPRLQGVAISIFYLKSM